VGDFQVATGGGFWVAARDVGAFVTLFRTGFTQNEKDASRKDEEAQR